MFSLTKTFTKEQFQVTPILMEGEPIFLPQEIGEQLGYVNLADSIRNSDRAKEGIDYFVIEGEKLRQLKELLSNDENHRRSNTPSVKISPNVNSLIILTESGIWWTTFNSTKPECIALRIWVTHEVLPSIRKTGGYGKGKALSLFNLNREWQAAVKMLKLAGKNKPIAMIEGARLVEQRLGENPYAIMGIEPPVVANVIEEAKRNCDDLYQWLLKLYHDNPAHFNRKDWQGYHKVATEDVWGHVDEARGLLCYHSTKLNGLMKKYGIDWRGLSELRRQGLLHASSGNCRTVRVNRAVCWMVVVYLPQGNMAVSN